MYSFDNINYSLRPNKVIQRHIAFDGLEMAASVLGLRKAKYIGFGSIWFSDFILAHKRLGIDDMTSIEIDEVTYKRAKFNAPFRTIKVLHAHSSVALDEIASVKAARKKPWVVWLDYVSGPTKEVREDIDRIIDTAPMGSALLVTLNVVGRTVGSGLEGRRDHLRDLFGDAIAEDALLADFQEDNLPAVVAACVTAYISSRCQRLVQRTYLPAFNMAYRDNAQMLTIGGFFPAARHEKELRTIVARKDWPGFPTHPIETPPLTPKELTTLQRILPSRGVLTDADLARLGFALEEGMLDVYCAHYRRYPSFFQVVA